MGPRCARCRSPVTIAGAQHFGGKLRGFSRLAIELWVDLGVGAGTDGFEQPRLERTFVWCNSHILEFWLRSPLRGERLKQARQRHHRFLPAVQDRLDGIGRKERGRDGQNLPVGAGWRG